ncbi:MAG: tRNA (N6-isopentenyl adenosine(37)-C2)-methylthiotransferase MiaB, partial [Lachnospiraceae bacterium]
MKDNLLENIDITKDAPIKEPDRQYYFIKKARKYVKELSEKLGRPLYSKVETFGCQMNARDSEKLVGILGQI